MNIYKVYSPENHVFTEYMDQEQAEEMVEYMNEFYLTSADSDKQYHIESVELNQEH